MLTVIRLQNVDFQNISLLSCIDGIDEYFANRELYVGQYAKGETVYNRNDACTTLDVILSGSLIAYSLLKNGSATTVFEFESGGILGANLLFAQSNKYPLNIYCLSDCTLVHIQRHVVIKLLHHHPFVMQYIQSLSFNSQGLNQRIDRFFHKTLRENILDYLKRLSVEQRSNTVVLPISKKQWADFLGVQRPSLFRELKKMKEEGLIDIKNRIITIR